MAAPAVIVVRALVATLSVPPKPEVTAREPPLSGGRVRDAKEYFATLDHRFQPGASKDLHAVYQFDLSGPHACAYHVAIDNGAMKRWLDG
jgi:hypothetical protein